MKKAKAKMNTPVYLGMSVLGINKTLTFDFWHDYIKPKYEDNANLCCMSIDSFFIQIKIEGLYKNIADDVKKWFDESHYGEDDKRPLPNNMNEKVI